MKTTLSRRAAKRAERNGAKIKKNGYNNYSLLTDGSAFFVASVPTGKKKNTAKKNNKKGGKK